LPEIVVEVPVAQGDPKETGEEMIREELGRLRDHIAFYWHNYALGIANFTRNETFASEADVEADYLHATFMVICKKAFDLAMTAAGEKWSPWGEIFGTAESVVEAWVSASESEDRNRGEVEVSDYIGQLTNGIDKQERAMLEAVEQA